MQSNIHYYVFSSVEGRQQEITIFQDRENALSTFKQIARDPLTNRASVVCGYPITEYSQREISSQDEKIMGLEEYPDPLDEPIESAESEGEDVQPSIQGGVEVGEPSQPEAI